MSGTRAAAAKARLLGADGLLQALPGLEDVTVAYSLPRDVPREIVYGGPVAGEVSLATMRAGGRIKRQEDLAMALVIRVNDPGRDTTEATDVRAVEIGTAIEEYIAGNPTLDDLPDLKLAAVQAVELDGWVDDDGATTILALQVGLKSYLL